MEEYGYVTVEGPTISEAMKKLDELWRRIDPSYYECLCNLDKVDEGNSRAFFDSGIYYGAKMMAGLLFGPDLGITYVFANDGRCEHQLEAVDETNVR